MSGAWSAQLVMARFVSGVLKVDPDVLAQVPADDIFPDVNPDESPRRQLTHAYAGGFISAKPMGTSISQVSILWDVTAWEPRFSRQALEPLMAAVSAALIGPEMGGKTHRYVDGRTWDIAIDYDSDPVVGIDATQAQVWAPVRQRYRAWISPL